MLDEKKLLARLNQMEPSEIAAILRKALKEAGIEENSDVDGIYFEGLSPGEPWPTDIDGNPWNPEETDYVASFLEECQNRGLSGSTIKAYRTNIRQFCLYLNGRKDIITEESVADYISSIQSNFKQNTANQKIAVLSLFLDYLVENRVLEENPMKKLNIKQQKQEVPCRTVDVGDIAGVLRCAYHEKEMAEQGSHAYLAAIRDIAVLELLFLSGMRVSELCHLRVRDIDLESKTVSITGHGNRERTLRIDNEETVQALKQYQKEFWPEMASSGYYFVNRLGRGLSDQSVRNMVRHYAKQAGVGKTFTPKVLRDSVAATLAEEGVDLVSLQHMMGHNSITRTKRYVHGSGCEIPDEKHPRKRIKLATQK